MRKGKEHVSVTLPATSVGMLGEHDLSSDTSRNLTCLLKGEPFTFFVVALGGMEIRRLKPLIHEEVRTKRGIIRVIDLVLLKWVTS